MTPEAHALAKALLNHHKQSCQARSVAGASADSHLISYTALCERAGLPWLTRAVGPFLREVAEWCQANGWPPINSLAVNAGTRMPGEGYDGADRKSVV